MCSYKKKEKGVSSLKEDHDLADFADLILETLKKKSSRSEEPFELYAQKVRKRIYKNIDSFRERFSKGYEVLVDSLSQELKKK